MPTSWRPALAHSILVFLGACWLKNSKSPFESRTCMSSLYPMLFNDFVDIYVIHIIWWRKNKLELENIKFAQFSAKLSSLFLEKLHEHSHLFVDNFHWSIFVIRISFVRWKELAWIESISFAFTCKDYLGKIALISKI